MDIFCDSIPLKDLIETCTVHGLPQDVTLNSSVFVHLGVMSQRNTLINIGDFVKITSGNVSVIVIMMTIIISIKH